MRKKGWIKFTQNDFFWGKSEDSNRELIIILSAACGVLFFALIGVISYLWHFFSTSFSMYSFLSTCCWSKSSIGVYHFHSFSIRIEFNFESNGTTCQAQSSLNYFSSEICILVNTYFSKQHSGSKTLIFDYKSTFWYMFKESQTQSHVLLWHNALKLPRRYLSYYFYIIICSVNSRVGWAQGLILTSMYYQSGQVGNASQNSQFKMRKNCRYQKSSELFSHVKISEVQKFSGFWKPMYEPSKHNLSFDFIMPRKNTPHVLSNAMDNVHLVNVLTCTSLFGRKQRLFCEQNEILRRVPSLQLICLTLIWCVSKYYLFVTVSSFWKMLSY